MYSMTDVTQILNAIEQGDPSASEQLLPVVYEELRVLARQRLANEKPGQTLQATALVHEAYLRLVGKVNDQSWDHRGHFFAAAAEAMRRILIEAARKRARREAIRGQQVSLEDLSSVNSFSDSQLIQLNDSLEGLEETNQLAAEIVKLRVFAGFTVKQVSEALKTPVRTIERNWTFARTWLHREMEDCQS